MKIIILGPGAMGSLFAAILSKSKQEVWLFDKNKERCHLLNQHGISVEGVLGNFVVKVKATTNIKDIGSADLIIICVKAYDTKEATLAIKPLIGANTRVLTLQNGIGNVEIISEIAGDDNVIGGITNMGATLLAPGRVRYAGKGETVIGRMDGKIPVELKSVRELFNAQGIETRISRDIKGLIWSKLIVNVGINALTAITRLNNGKLIEFEGSRRILMAAVTEATRIAKRKKIKLIYDDPLAKVEAVCLSTANNVSSMLQDILKDKRTEIDFINGVVVRLGQELGIAVPVNVLLVDLIKTIESSYAFRVGAV